MEGDRKFHRLIFLSIYFNPLPPHGGRLLPVWSLPLTIPYFNPLPPHGGRPAAYGGSFSCAIFQSTPSAWRETLGEEAYDKLHEISIHSLRMEGDQYNTRSSDHGRLFQSTPSAWRETASATAKNFDFIFQSTPSAWRETEVGDPILEEFVFQSTPSAWRETSTVVLPAPRSAISIHSLRMEGD